MYALCLELEQMAADCAAAPAAPPPPSAALPDFQLIPLSSPLRHSNQTSHVTRHTSHVTRHPLLRLLAWDALLGMVLSRLPKDAHGLDCDVFERSDCC